MKLRTFGPTGRRVPIIGLGTWQLEADDPREALRALEAGIEAGMTHIDTAELYGDGAVEQFLGRAIAGKRDRLFLVSKVMPTNASTQGVIQACERSLQRLGTDYLDTYLLHWTGKHPLAGTIRGFEQLITDGKIRAWGVSNFALDELQEAETIAGRGRMACNQVLYHLRERTIEHEIVPWCASHGVALVGYSPFAAGDFPTPGSPGYAALEAVAGRRGATVRQVTLAFLTREPHMFAIPKVGQAAHAVENAGAGELQLNKQDIAEIGAAFPVGPRRPGVPML